MNYARIVDGVAVEIFNPQEGFTIDQSMSEDFVKLFVEVPEEVTVNSAVDAKGKWTMFVPVETQAPEVAYQKITPMTFQMLFTSSERISIKKNVPTDPIIEDWWSLVTNPQLTEVDLNLVSVQEALDYLVTLKIISSERKTEILSAKLK